ncbi:MAG: LacI family DNA-binding transcriptional regulator [Roseobacter sp.]
MKELSKAIGISRPTLSRYFQDPSNVRPSTSRKIEDRLAKVDYVYNFFATRQNRKSSGLIGVIIPHYEDLYFASILTAIENAASQAGFTVITQCSNGAADGEPRAVARLRSMGADGAIVAPLGLHSSTESFRLAREDFPVVFVDSRPAEPINATDFVGTNNTQSIAKVIEYLCRTGEAPVFLGMPAVTSNAFERQAAYACTMQQLGLRSHMIEVQEPVDAWAFESFGLTTMDGHFSRQQYTTDTILCANDRIAIGAIRAANKHGLFVAKRSHQPSLRIAGHDDHPLSRFMFPAITTARQDIDGIGADAVRLLVERIREERNGAGIAQLKGVTLKIRESA